MHKLEHITSVALIFEFSSLWLLLLQQAPSSSRARTENMMTAKAALEL